MPLHAELLAQAENQVISDESEAGARRAVSTAYYALFHLLLSDAAELLMPTAHPSLRLQMRRAFAHSDMRAVCKQFAIRNVDALPPSTKGLITPPIELQLAETAKDFLDLQEARIIADYDLAFPATQSWALDKVIRAKAAFPEWAAVKQTPNAGVFLMALLLQRHWSRTA